MNFICGLWIKWLRNKLTKLFIALRINIFHKCSIRLKIILIIFDTVLKLSAVLIRNLISAQQTIDHHMFPTTRRPKHKQNLLTRILNELFNHSCMTHQIGGSLHKIKWVLCIFCIVLLSSINLWSFFLREALCTDCLIEILRYCFFGNC